MCLWRLCIKWVMWLYRIGALMISDTVIGIGTTLAQKILTLFFMYLFWWWCLYLGGLLDTPKLFKLFGGGGHHTNRLSPPKPLILLWVSINGPRSPVAMASQQGSGSGPLHPINSDSPAPGDEWRALIGRHCEDHRVASRRPWNWCQRSVMINQHDWYVGDQQQWRRGPPNGARHL